MSKLVWGETGSKKISLGVSKGVLFVRNASGAYPTGVAWTGLTAVNEQPSGGENTKIYADNSVYGVLTSNEEFGFTIEAYQSPEEFDECDGMAETSNGITLTQQARKTFGFSYRTEIRSDVSDEAGYVIHVVYGCKATPSEASHSSINESPEGETLSWTVETVPVEVSGFKPVAHIKFDSTKLTKAQMEKVEKTIYGDTDTEASLPLPDAFNTLLQTA